MRLDQGSGVVENHFLADRPGRSHDDINTHVLCFGFPLPWGFNGGPEALPNGTQRYPPQNLIEVIVLTGLRKREENGSRPS